MGNGCGCGESPKLKYSVAAKADLSIGGKGIQKKQDNIKPQRWFIGYRETAAGKIPVVTAKLSFRDIVGGWKVRWGIGRMNYRIEPGLYAIGNPDENSPVFVTANYKLTVDKVRRELTGIDGWILVLDTKGVNVWCAAGKGTFGTAELVKKIFSTDIGTVVKHRRLIVPQLGAVGVSAHEVAKLTGFKVVFGPVRACDIKEFLRNDFRKTEAMRTVYFPLMERLAVAPIEVVQSFKYAAGIFVVLGILSVIEHRALTPDIVTGFLPFLGAILAGTLLFPALLPYLPFRSFAAKGYVLGLVSTGILAVFAYTGLAQSAVWLLILPPIVSFLSLNFTGASTYTSLTGTKLELAISLPLLGISAAAGIFLKIGLLVKSMIA